VAREDRSSKERRRVVRTTVATFHEAELAGLVEHVAEIERYQPASSTCTTSTK
jgi:hypothetical protein